MPEAWGNANAVDLLRDMLVQERTEVPATAQSRTTLHLLAGLPAVWIAKVGETVSVQRTPTTLGTVVSLKLTRISQTMLHLDLDPGTRTTDAFVHIPLPDGSQLSEVRMEGRPMPKSAIDVLANGEQAIVSVPALSHPVSFDFMLTPTSVEGAAR
jgi:hypothetical protein